ncbi:type II toxin-antitoxin system VapC family toxin [Brevundimonas goettingensis]|uniref:Ribonuclease VapC n=1 Tax=Brevundimonas goettingensis TaxID=2774190 RepID=A0A975C7L6_9CAUL|nr:type II toxin-antitoxin system VapC family toxin [Brevundimonas goettingensis]QTC92676.1 type II toxin-antitoxin system VapC family toxin [Brevundimonas goettingensis]
MIVIDASIMLAWLLPDEDSEAAEPVIVLARTAGAVAPAVFPLEVANAMRTNILRRRIDNAYRDKAISQFERVGVARDLEAFEPEVLAETIRLSDLHGLTIYDAAYLELARRIDCPIGSFDTDLRKAAQAENVPVYPQ